MSTFVLNDVAPLSLAQSFETAATEKTWGLGAAGGTTGDAFPVATAVAFDRAPDPWTFGVTPKGVWWGFSFVAEAAPLPVDYTEILDRAAWATSPVKPAPGSSWSNASGATVSASITDLESVGDTIVAILAGYGRVRSTDRGASWAEEAGEYGGSGCLASNGADFVLARSSAASDWLVQSQAGYTWTIRDTGSSGPYACACWSGTYFYAFRDDATRAIMRSANGRNGWTTMGYAPEGTYRLFANGDTVLALTVVTGPRGSEQRLYVSSDGAQTFAAAYVPTPNGPPTAYIGTAVWDGWRWLYASDRAVFQSIDGGLAWTTLWASPSGESKTNVQLLVVAGQYLLVSSNAGAYTNQIRSSPDGVTWTDLSDSGDVLTCALVFKNNAVWVGGQESGGLWALNQSYFGLSTTDFVETINATAAATGAVTSARAVSGVLAGVSTATGAVTSARAVSDVLAGVSTATGIKTDTTVRSEVRAGVSTATGIKTDTTVRSEVRAGVSTATGIQTDTTTRTSTVAGTSTATGARTDTRAITETGAATSAATGARTDTTVRTEILGGAAAATPALTEVYVPGTGDYTETINATAAATGARVDSRGYTDTLAATSAATGATIDVYGSVELRPGTSVATGAVSGDMGRAYAEACAGTSTATGTSSGIQACVEGFASSSTATGSRTDVRGYVESRAGVSTATGSRTDVRGYVESRAGTSSAVGAQNSIASRWEASASVSTATSFSTSVAAMLERGAGVAEGSAGLFVSHGAVEVRGGTARWTDEVVVQWVDLIGATSAWTSATTGVFHRAHLPTLTPEQFFAALSPGTLLQVRALEPRWLRGPMPRLIQHGLEPDTEMRAGPLPVHDVPVALLTPRGRQ